jgi:hypothetical protein
VLLEPEPNRLVRLWCSALRDFFGDAYPGCNMLSEVFRGSLAASGGRFLGLTHAAGPAEQVRDTNG